MMPALLSDRCPRKYPRPPPAIALPLLRSLRVLDPLCERLRPMHGSLRTEESPGFPAGPHLLAAKRERVNFHPQLVAATAGRRQHGSDSRYGFGPVRAPA